MHEMTAAHKTLPFHTLVEVHNLDNGQRIRVRITDRGPFVKGRIIDLSYEAAQRIGMIGTGIAKVEIRVLETAGSSRASSTQDSVEYTVQLAAFRDRRYADELVRNLNLKQKARVERAGDWYRVRVGHFRNESEAKGVRDTLLKQGHEAIVIRLRGQKNSNQVLF